ncbi:exodeoxyribonuclease III [Candidatus Campbellbacteria bacterium CG11_big_fil_rev_8_21_14_0_20_44_21]|uniref:Exodeoxyribonuclease III n=1 Tax=Candidatus Campbellbacteria bacterium CG22_combo_CG10-13_8_21_14_all_43_18 TaxID=1974530 RepID=A0A2H0DXD7_9BACT|nr:MAG: exodeoxyribonuclease III [Candidatus Campbellbacteria bacterium CG22_combo_CG10-13_8_21_14_all_43_18]PIR24240.1 MAG: exodeoxyribonuclease III [Candidatus Campbellbacteria bacterium CG11_big_fil_rev_8_21_14_0_20_44_21]
MRLSSWNVNGLRAVQRKGHWRPFIKKDFDIISLQETKAHPSQLSEELQNPSGYFSYFNSSDLRKGYSGVVIYSKEKALKSEKLKNLKIFDEEGRVLILHFKKFVLINAYFPMTGRDERLSYKLEFNDAILAKMERLKKEGKKIILCGDLNVAHEEIDLARPKENEGRAGFRPEERAWLDELVSLGYIDVFRHLYPRKKGIYTYWDLKTRARERNVGWRIDYFFISPGLIKDVNKFETLTNFYGSDHCPILLDINIQ